MIDDEPIEPALHQTMNVLGNVLADTFPDLCFALFVFTPEEPRANYISNASRENMIEVMKEFIERNKGKP